MNGPIDSNLRGLIYREGPQASILCIRRVLHPEIENQVSDELWSHVETTIWRNCRDHIRNALR